MHVLYRVHAHVQIDDGRDTVATLSWIRFGSLPELVDCISPHTSICHNSLPFCDSVRSLLITSTHHREVPSGLLISLHSLHCYFCGQCSGIICKCLNHWCLFTLSCYLTGSSPGFYDTVHRKLYATQKTLRLLSFKGYQTVNRETMIVSE